MKIPAVIGETTLAKFTDAAQLNAYVRATMPYWKPGSLTEEEAWSVTAFILRENDLWDGRTELNVANAAGVRISRGPTLTPVATSPQAAAEIQDEPGAAVWVALMAIPVLLLVMFVLKKFRNTTKI
jgi:hypothetical protein